MSIIVHKASAAHGRKVPNLAISASRSWDGSRSEYDPAPNYQAEAERIASALQESLPRATWDRLVAVMVERHATLLIYPCEKGDVA